MNLPELILQSALSLFSESTVQGNGWGVLVEKEGIYMRVAPTFCVHDLLSEDVAGQLQHPLYPPEEHNVVALNLWQQEVRQQGMSNMKSLHK